MRIAWIVAVTACGSSGGGGKQPPMTGELDVTITSPAAPQVTVTGPNGFSMVLSATTALTDLDPGDYTATPALLEVAGPIVGTVHLVRFPASVLVGAGTASLLPDVTLTTTAGGLGGIAFDPKPR